MEKRKIIACSLIVMMLASCGGMSHSIRKDEVTYPELEKMGLSLDRYEKKELSISKDDETKIAELLGHPLKYYPESLTYYREIRHHYGEIGDIVPLYQATPYGRLSILVRIRWNAIDKIIVVENVTKEGTTVVNDVFLSQFHGKTASSSYKVVETPQDLLAVRNNIRPIYGEPLISREIAGRLQEVMAIHEVDRF